MSTASAINAAKRWITVFTSCLSMTTAGSLFSFSVLTDGLKKQLSYTSSDLNTISGIGNSSLYLSFLFIGPIFDIFGAQWTMLFAVIFYGLGYLLMYLAYSGTISGSTGAMSTFYFIAGMGSTCAYMGTIVGKVVGTLLLFYGLSGTIYSQIFYGGYSNSTQGYFLFLTLSVSVVNFVCCFTTFNVPPPNKEEAKDKDMNEIDTKNRVQSDLEELTPIGKQGKAASNESLSSIPELLLVHHSIRRERSGSLKSDSLSTLKRMLGRSNDESITSGGRVSKVSRYTYGTRASQVSRATTKAKSMKSKKDGKESLYVASREGLSINNGDDGGERDLSPLEILKSPIFWLYAGLTYMSNFFLILEAALGSSVTDSGTLALKNTTHVTIMSVFQALGRVSFSLLLDFFASSPRIKVDRSILLFVAQLLVLLPTLVLACGATSESALYFCSIFIGYGFGCGGACFPVCTKDFSELSFTYGTACGFVMAGVPIGIIVSNMVFGKLYDAQSAGASICYGSGCYSTSYIALSAVECIAVVSSLFLVILREREKTRENKTVLPDIKESKESHERKMQDVVKGSDLIEKRSDIPTVEKAEGNQGQL
ncbi:MFS general substrate transporter [Rhizoclosmatium globosum]|uniref:MFS general substrate transporter n=1 Tax=Rhizoclosmatium globosum TaxID=329046 RepID=A0A1Y2CBM8_9FUNG|nr:MFS general substrate transporter [Rhizoclosmatium globosum]|eukprot:ORY43735.1 MFS general substrate transporter [Rhizoclosmatium globosum]